MCVTMIFARLDWSPLKPSQGVAVLLQNYLRILGRVSPRPTVHLWPVGAGQTPDSPVRKIYVRNFHQRFSHMRTSFPGLSSNH